VILHDSMFSVYISCIFMRRSCFTSFHLRDGISYRERWGFGEDINHFTSLCFVVLLGEEGFPSFDIGL
jgi:hypothetical protein